MHDNFSIIIISFSLPSVLLNVLRSIRSLTNATDIELFISNGDGNSVSSEIITLSNIFNINIRISPIPLSIGEARKYAIKFQKHDFVIFLDDDCIPSYNWYRSIKNYLIENKNDINNIGMIYGPREPDKGNGIGTIIRHIEGRYSRKYLYKGRTPVYFSKKNNFIVRRWKYYSKQKTSRIN